MSKIGRTNGGNGATGAGPIDVGAWQPPNPPGLIQSAPNPPNVDLRALEQTLNRMLGNEDPLKDLLRNLADSPKSASFVNDADSVLRDIRKVERDLHDFTHARPPPTGSHAIRG